MIQVGEQVSESEETSMNNIKAKPESKSKAENLVVKGNNVGQKSEAGDAIEMTIENAPIQLC